MNQKEASASGVKPASKTGFSSLPTELKFLVFSYLPGWPVDVCLVSKEWKDLLFETRLVLSGILDFSTDEQLQWVCKSCPRLRCLHVDTHLYPDFQHLNERVKWKTPDLMALGQQLSSPSSVCHLSHLDMHCGHAVVPSMDAGRDCLLSTIGLKHLEYFTDLQTLDMSCCGPLLPDELQYVANLPKLKTLKLSSFYIKRYRWTDGMQILASGSICNTLQHLDLSKTMIVDGAFSHVGALTSLRRLNLSHCKWVSAVGLVVLSKLENLEHLELRSVPINTVAFLAGMKRLRHLNLRRCSELTNQGIEPLVGLSESLETLGMGYCEAITDDGLVHLGKLKSLKALDISFDTLITDEGLQHLCSLPNLELLGLNNCIRIVTLQALEQMTSLIELSLRNLDITNESLEHFKNLSNLRRLEMPHCWRINNQGLQHLGKNLVRLQTLNIASCKEITEQGVLYLTDLTSLRHLNISNCELLDDRALAHMTKLSQLQTMKLDDTSVTDEGLPFLASLTRLRSLNLNQTDITGKGLASLSSLRNLERCYYEGQNQLNRYARYYSQIRGNLVNAVQKLKDK